MRGVDVTLEEANNGRWAPEKLIRKIHMTTLPVQGQADSLGVPLLGIIAHRLADYMANAKSMSLRAYEDIRIFVDTLVDILEGNIPMDSNAALLVRKLPAKIGFDVGDVESRNVEAMLVMLHGTATHSVEREMNECGYRTNTVTTTFEAFPLIVRTLPDLVIISAMMDELDGLNLAAALVAMPATRNIPIAVITSLDPENEHLKMLPDKVPVIFKGPSFGDDLAEALSALFIIWSGPPQRQPQKDGHHQQEHCARKEHRLHAAHNKKGTGDDWTQGLAGAVCYPIGGHGRPPHIGRNRAHQDALIGGEADTRRNTEQKRRHRQSPYIGGQGYGSNGQCQDEKCAGHQVCFTETPGQAPHLRGDYGARYHPDGEDETDQRWRGGETVDHEEREEGNENALIDGHQGWRHAEQGHHPKARQRAPHIAPIGLKVG